jgi:hypothetical protein
VILTLIKLKHQNYEEDEDQYNEDENYEDDDNLGDANDNASYILKDEN